MQSPIINPQSSIRHNPTECGQMRRKFVRARVPFIHARTRAHEELAQKRGHGAPRAPSHVIPAKAGIYPQTTPFPLQNTPFPLPFRHSRPRLRHSRTHPRHSRTLPRHSRAGGNPALPNRQSTICNQQFSPSRRRQESTQCNRMRRNAAKTRARTREGEARFPPSRE